MKEDYNDFYYMIIEVVKEIPKGYVLTYKKIAEMIGYPKNARLVGTTMSRIKENDVPCHRVIKSSGELAPEFVFGGNQRKLLENEGITFFENGKVKIKKHLY